MSADAESIRRIEMPQRFRRDALTQKRRQPATRDDAIDDIMCKDVTHVTPISLSTYLAIAAFQNMSTR